jgi:hypothetical protein
MGHHAGMTKKSPIEDLRSARDRAATRLAAEAAALERAKSAAIATAAGDDDAKFNAAIEAQRHSELRHLALTEALAKADRDLESALSAENDRADRAQREATAADLNIRATGIEDSAAQFFPALDKLLAAAETGRPIFGAIGLFDVLRELMTQLPGAIATLAGEVRAAALATLDRSSGRPPTLRIEPLAIARRARRWSLSWLGGRCNTGSRASLRLLRRLVIRLACRKTLRARLSLGRSPSCPMPKMRRP